MVRAIYWIRHSGIFLSIEISVPYMIADTINLLKNVVLKATLWRSVGTSLGKQLWAHLRNNIS